MSDLRRRKEEAWQMLGALGWPQELGDALGGTPGGGGLLYLLRDDFTTAAVAPLTSPRTCEPGPGTLTLVQVDGQFSIATDKIDVPVQATAAWGDQGWYYPTGFARVAGRALLGQWTLSDLSQGKLLAWFTAAALPTNQSGQQHSFYAVTQLGAVSSASAVFTFGFNLSTATDYQFAIVLQATGALFFIKGGAFASWTLLWYETEGTTTPLYPGSQNFDFAGTSEYFRVRDLSAPFTIAYALATVRDTTLTSGDTFTGTADAMSEFEFTLNGSPSAGDEVTLEYHRQDANNKWKAYLKRNVGNTAWDFSLDRVIAGVVVSQIIVAGVGTPNMIRVTHEGSLHNCYTRAAGVWTKRGSQVSDANFSTETGLAVVAVAGTTLNAVNDFPRTSAVYTAELDQV